jgi:hypothetical protein
MLASHKIGLGQTARELSIEDLELVQTTINQSFWVIRNSLIHYC